MCIGLVSFCMGIWGVHCLVNRKHVVFGSCGVCGSNLFASVNCFQSTIHYKYVSVLLE